MFGNLLPLTIVVSDPTKALVFSNQKILSGISDISVDTEPVINFGLKSLYMIPNESYLLSSELDKNNLFVIEISAPANEPSSKLARSDEQIYYNLKLFYDNNELANYKSFHFSAGFDKIKTSVILELLPNTLCDINLPEWITIINDET